MSAAIVSRWARRYVLISALFLLVWQIGMLVGFPRRTEVLLGMFGFVLHMIFGKAYSLVPSYFERELEITRAPAVQFPLTVGGTCSLAVSSVLPGLEWLEPIGAILWGLGVGVFLVGLLWTIRGNLTGEATGTGEANADRRSVDRVANGFVPVALGYLAIGSYEAVAIHTTLPMLFDGYFPRVSHLLAAGTATMLVFALGFRLLPRFLVASPPARLVILVLPAGALGPLLLATTLGSSSTWFALGAVIEAVAVIGFALVYGVLFVRSERRRVGFYGVLTGVASGVLAIILGLSFALGHLTPSLALAHFRLNVLGFLGLTIVGVAYQFYPPAIGTFRGASNHAALLSIGCLAGGLLIQVVGLVVPLRLLILTGELLTLIGTVVYVYQIIAVFHAR
ncbi:hypothetical protein [Halococcus saccharolyticus]|uniref:Uncharacterized protein n=1 Tax=Halococcus saccharolyticus DSM 5350 TaxID=1227455 RepID=M0MNN4_9EURY|nr:hypothetical protein [Halococcus saccharolyticus]EMA46030.1 hypothetical protein C449_04977 [Halococcus saccharolyticus DSM 5350]